jgi:hypothetical protein
MSRSYTSSPPNVSMASSGPAYLAYNLSSLDSLVVLYNALIRSKLEYASVVWNNLTLIDSNKIENLQRNFANLCYLFSFLNLVFYVIMV